MLQKPLQLLGGPRVRCVNVVTARGFRRACGMLKAMAGDDRERKDFIRPQVAARGEHDAQHERQQANDQEWNEDLFPGPHHGLLPPTFAPESMNA